MKLLSLMLFIMMRLKIFFWWWLSYDFSWWRYIISVI